MTALYVRREALERVERGEPVGDHEVAVVLGAAGPFVDAMTWGGMRSLVERHRFDELWCPSPRREIRSGRAVHLFDRPHADLHLSPGPARVFIPECYSLAAARRALAGYGLRLGKVICRKRYGPAGYRYLGTTWSVRGCFREPVLS
jgi:hypothetical protein